MKIPALTNLFFIPFFTSALSFHNPWTQAKTLNHGQSHWSFDTTYESIRKTETLPNTQVTSTWAQLLKNSKDQQEFAALDAKRTASGQSLDSNAAVTKYELYQQITTMNLSWAYGIYKHWMIGFEVPMISSNQKIRSQSQGPAGANIAATANQQLSDAGIRSDRTQYSEQRLGDVSLLSQIQLGSYRQWIFAFQQRVGIPTAAQPDERNLFITRAGNGQPSVGGRLLTTWQPRRVWQLNLSGGYLWRPKDEVRIRLPDGEGNVSGDIETGVTRDMGDVYDAQVEGIFRRGTFDWIAGYRLLHKQSDKYQGSFVAQERYDELSSNTEWTRQLMSLGALYHIGTQRAGVQDGYSVLVAGHWPLRNESPLWSLDLRMMF